MTDAGLPPDLPGEARPNFGAQPVPSAQPAQSAEPAAPAARDWTPPAYLPPEPRPARPPGMSTGAKVGLFSGLGCLVLVVVPIIIVAAMGVSSSLSNDVSDDPWPPSVSDSDATSNGNTPGAVEVQWKSGVDWLTPPTGEPAPRPFTDDYETAAQWLQFYMGADFDLSVVFTADPAINCGMADSEPLPTAVIGCYNPDYGDTLIMWWGDEASDDLKKLGVLHEYSHYWQHWENFDATRSAEDAGLLADPEFVRDVYEVDATCRIYIDWHNTDLRYLDNQLAAPCGDTGWGEHWFENALLEREVMITDY